MSVLVKGMAMPDSCEECKLCVYDRGCRGCLPELRIINREKNENKPKWCPLIELPDHGDLIERDEAADDACFIWCRNSAGDDAVQEIIEHLREMKAVIPAERSEE